MRKKMTITITGINPGEIKGQLIAEGKAKGYTVKFDVLENLFKLSEGEKILLELRDKPPRNLEDYVFCGHGYIVRDVKQEQENQQNITIFSVWGIIFRFEPAISDLEPGVKYYLCISRQK